MMTIVLWKWAQANMPNVYTAERVNIMAEMVRRHLGIRHRIVCVTDDDAGITECDTFSLWPDYALTRNPTLAYLPSCHRRLKLFDPGTQEAMRIEPGSRICSLDLDAVISASLDDIMQTPGKFVGWRLPGTFRPFVFNGSFQMFTAGELAFLWENFTTDGARQAAEDGYLGSDQAWLSYNLVDDPENVGLTYPQIASWPLQTRVRAELDPHTAITFFHGVVKPWDREAVASAPWIRRHYRKD